MTPAAFAYLWGFRAISEASTGILLDVAIVTGALLFVLAIFGTARQAWKRKPVAVVCLIMLALSLVLFGTRSEFGLFKIAMYFQPFLLGVMVLTWDDLRDRSVGSAFCADVCWLAALALVIGFGARGQLVLHGSKHGTGRKWINRNTLCVQQRAHFATQESAVLPWHHHLRHLESSAR